jgi:UDP-N-acetylmuramate: L-alanyl-gamma-D-glutamyl-meso-diaminopimelate ligase
MHLHFLGICGTFMGSLALLAREMGHQVTGCDSNIYPPMSTQLEEQGISIYQGYGAEQFARFKQAPDLVLIGNALSRGNEAVEYVLNKRLVYTSGPQWLSENLLNKKWVLAVAGTHGKTTTTSMLAWILEQAGYNPGFLIGGVPTNFPCSARLSDSDFFVIEADEYDTAFFDKRSKFIHYHPNTLVLNNLEYDHADIFPNIEAIQTQFQHLLRIVPSEGLVIYPENEQYLCEVLAKGCWSEQAKLKNKVSTNNENIQGWSVEKLKADGSQFCVRHGERNISAEISWDLIGDHNIQNGFSACVAAFHVGVPLEHSAQALGCFKNVKRRLEKLADLHLTNELRVCVYDDFAHHPTAIETTLAGLRASVGNAQIIAVIEPRSNTMKMGAHGDKLAEACMDADLALWYLSEKITAIKDVLNPDGANKKILVYNNTEALVDKLLDRLKKISLSEKGEKEVHIVVMSNGSFEGIHKKIITILENEG